MGLTIHVSDDHGRVVIALAGDLDIYTVRELRRSLAMLTLDGSPVIVDVSGVSFVDSSGLGALVSLRAAAQQAGGRMGVVCPRGPVRRIFEITGLADAFAVGDSREHVAARLTAPDRILPD